ncbi:MAG: hypothetical protein IPK52_18225 [Chloroflexi bacterium]|nr:hypothetical protein [Chloroflexota bacterium]
MKPLAALIVLLLAFNISVQAAPAHAAPLTCDSELQTFSTEGAYMRVTSKYVYKLPDGAAPDQNALDDGVEAYLDGALPAITQLRSEPSSAAAVSGQAQPGTVWLVTGAPQCVEEPQFNGAVTIYVPVEAFEGGFTGWLVESRNWKNIDLQALTVLAPSQTLKRLSLYFLEPQIVNPNISLDVLDFALPEPEPACFAGALNHIRIGDSAYRYNYNELLGDVETPWYTEYDLGVAFGVGMPLFSEVFVPLNAEKVSTETWYNFLYVNFKHETSPYAVTPRGLNYKDEILVLDGPVCSRINYDSSLKDIDGNLLQSSIDVATVTWYRLRATVDGQQYEGWFPESVAWAGITLSFVNESLTVRHHFAAYYLGPDSVTDADKGYIQNWDLPVDLTLGESGAKYQGSLFGFSREVSEDSCDLALPTRLDAAPRARVVASALNMRPTPSTSGEPLIGLGQNSVVRLTGFTRCADGLRWWSASVGGGALGTRIVDGWVAEHDSAVYYLEPLADRGPSEYVARPTAVPPTATATPLPVVNATQPPAPTQIPTIAPTPTDPTPG